MNPDVFVPTERRLDPSYLRRLLHDIDLSHHTIYCSDWPPGDPKMFPPIRTNQNRYSNWNQSSWPDVEEVWSAFFVSGAEFISSTLLLTQFDLINSSITYRYQSPESWPNIWWVSCPVIQRKNILIILNYPSCKRTTLWTCASSKALWINLMISSEILPRVSFIFNRRSSRVRGRSMVDR